MFFLPMALFLFFYLLKLCLSYLKSINILVYNINDDGTLTHIVDFTDQASLKLDGDNYYYTTPMFVQLSELYMIYSWKGSSIYTMPNYPNIPVENDNYYYYIKGK